ncbi:2OG-Fe(II)oxygenase [Phlyctema vagabunda]|uniref:2OG-Fe(II)oxygenase n=1 Tax=Phlyctema vagabunda TaxID=108571 RepID=A0ABR4P374_9HELO
MGASEASPAPGYSLLKLSSAEGPVYRPVKSQAVRDARPGEIPLIDVSGMFSESLPARRAVADQIRHAATTIGFFYMSQHGIASTSIDAAARSARDFFQQPAHKKEPLDSARLKGYNGWKPPATQKISEGESVDVRENFSITYSPTYDDATAGVARDQIPHEVARFLPAPEDELPWEKLADLVGFELHVMNYWKSCLHLARRLQRAFALSLSLDEDYFDSKTTFPDASLALNYYPTIRASSAEGAEGDVSIGSHTDFQFFTILWQDVVGGLQVLTPSGEWIRAAPIEGTLVVNIADYLMRITNDRYMSTVHRARNTSGKERLSMAFFFGFNLNERCGVLPSCVDAEHPAKYDEISCEEWIRKRIEATYIK